MAKLTDTNSSKLNSAKLVLEQITISLAYAKTAQNQYYKEIQVAVGTTLYEALQQAGWLEQFADLADWCEQNKDVQSPNVKCWHVGIYTQKQPLNYVLQNYDRIEVYRGLSVDPMNKRKKRAKRLY